MRFGKFVVAGILGLTAVACHGGKETEAPQALQEFTSGPSSPQELRKLTMQIRATPPAKLRASLEQLANGLENEDIANFLRGYASGFGGSGFVVLRNEAGGKSEEFVVTNKHVVSHSESAEIDLNNGQTYSNCDIVYTDDVYDLAVLAFPNGQKPVAYGLRPAEAAPQDLEVVIATGFPGMMGKPSYQTTDGKISNASYMLEDGDQKIQYIQHTASIDHGSSGGPLTAQNGDLVGVNTLFLKDRHSVFLAVPAEQVRQAVRTAFKIRQMSGDHDWSKRELVNACNKLTGELGSANPKVNVLDDMVSNRLVAEKGITAFASLAREPSIMRMFTNDPMEAMRRAIVVNLWLKLKQAGGISPQNTCDKIVASDETSIGKAQDIRMTILTGKGTTEFVWVFEHGHWRLSNAEF